MILVFALAWAALLILNASLVRFLEVFVHPFHSFCTAQVPREAHFGPWMSAVVCAERLPASLGVSDLQILGLVHITVVSGAQLFLLERTLSWMSHRFMNWRGLQREQMLTGFFSNSLILLALVTYGAMTALQAPLLRALFHLGLRRFSLRAKLFWRPAQITLVAGLLTLICAPDLAKSLSLQFGWLASLALSAPLFSTSNPPSAATPVKSRLQPTVTSLLRQAFLYVALLLPLLPLGVPHPISVLCNWLLTPVLGLVLFPLSAATLMFHALTPLTDFVWRNLLDVFHLISDSITPLDWKTPLPSYYGWIYLACLQVFFLFREREPCAD